MNIYEKLQKSRVALQKIAIKKSGNNKFAGYTYYELGDFLPKTQEILADNGLCGITTFTGDIATLTIYDNETGDQVAFTAPMAEATLKGCHPVQNLGASITYLRRYLWMIAMEMSEHDAVDAVTAKPGTKAEKPTYSDADFDKNLPSWKDIIDAGTSTSAKIVAMIETKFTMTDEQKEVLRAC